MMARPVSHRRHRQRAGAAAILLAVTCALMLTGCGSASSAHEKTLRLPLYGAVGVPDPATATGSSTLFLASLLFSGLVKFGPDMHIIPELAVSIPTISTDGRSYTFTVRQDARFADGYPCTAWDVAYSLQRALSPVTHSRTASRFLGIIRGAHRLETGQATTLSGVKVLDRLTIRIRLLHPDATFLDKLAQPVASVVDRRAIGPFSRGAWIAHPAGTGPWTVNIRDRDGALELSPRRHFYGGPLQLTSMLLIPVRDATDALALYQQGTLDAAEVPADRYASLSQRSDFQSSASLDAYYLLPLAGDGFTLAMSINRDRLVRNVGPSITSLNSIVPSSIPDYSASTLSSTQNAPTEVTPKIPRIRWLNSESDGWISGALQRSLRSQWRVEGWRGAVRLVRVSSPIPDPSSWLHLVLKQTKSRWFRAILNRTDQLTNDPVSRMNSYSRLENWALENGLVIPVGGGNVAYLIKPMVARLDVTPLGITGDNGTWASVSLT